MSLYDDFAMTFSNSRKNLSWPEIDAILAHIGDMHAESILDVGCGNGRLLREAEKHLQKFPKYLGIDASHNMIREAKRLHPDQDFRIMDMENLSELAPEEYDAVVMIASFHHLNSEASRILTLKNISKILAPHGKIYMTNWNLHAIEKYQKDHLGCGDYQIKIGKYTRYYHGFMLEEIRDLMEKTDFHVLENRIFLNGKNIVTIACADDN